jgi:hypothetical protein
LVSITRTTYEFGGQQVPTSAVVANFFEIPAAYPGCTTSTIGSCTISNCAAAADAGTPPDGGMVSAGALTITGLADGGLTLTPGGMTLTLGGGYAQTIQGDAFVAGAQLGVSAAGDRVPPFTAQVTAPTEATFTAPLCPAGICPAISKAAGLSVTWTGGVGTVVVQVLGLAGIDQVSCEYPAAAGTAMIPATAFASLPTETVLLGLYTLNASPVQAGQFTVKFVASASKAFQSSVVP